MSQYHNSRDNEAAEPEKNDGVMGDIEVLRRVGRLVGYQVQTPDGTGTLISIDTPHNGLYFEGERADCLVWYGTGNAQTGKIWATYRPREIIAVPDQPVHTFASLASEMASTRVSLGYLHGWFQSHREYTARYWGGDVCKVAVEVLDELHNAARGGVL